MKRTTPGIVLVTTAILLCGTRDASAYVDPGSSSYVFQLLVAGLTAFVFFFSSMKRKAGQVFRSLLSIKSKSVEEQQSIVPGTPRDV